MTTSHRGPGSAPGPRKHRRAEPRPRELAGGFSFALVYDLWIGSWETALLALATATQSGTLTTKEAAAHKAVIAAEREVVTKQLTLLLGYAIRRPATPAM